MDVVDEQGQPSADELELGKIFAALAEPLRLKVVTELLREEQTIERSCASFCLPVAKSTLTHHFRVLRESGLVYDVDYGNRRGVRLRRDDLDERFPGLLDAIGASKESAGATTSDAFAQ